MIFTMSMKSPFSAPSAVTVSYPSASVVGIKVIRQFFKKKMASISFLFSWCMLDNVDFLGYPVEVYSILGLDGRDKSELSISV